MAGSVEMLNQFRSVAVTVSSGRIWIEKVIPRTTPEIVINDAAMGEISAYLDDLIRDRERREHLITLALADFKRKLPEELSHILGDQERTLGLLEQVAPLLQSRLGRMNEIRATALQDQVGID